MSSRSDKTPLERLLDIGIYAPLGYVLTRKKTRQELIKAGRKQIAFSRSLGQAALKGLSRRSGSASHDTSATERATTAADSSDELSAAATEPEQNQADAQADSPEINERPSSPDATDLPAHDDEVSRSQDADDNASAPDDASPDPEDTSPEPDDTAIEGYDDMTAKQIIARVGNASQAQVLWIQQREMTTKERVTVLRAADKRLRALS